MATIKAVAKAAHVSQATVSRVINNHRAVNAETSRAVRQVMERLAYTPRARALRQGPRPRTADGIHSGLILFLEIGATKQSVEMLELLSGIQSAIQELNLVLVFANTLAGAELPRVIQTRQADGVLLHGES